jgi:hypothetical protein
VPHRTHILQLVEQRFRSLFTRVSISCMHSFAVDQRVTRIKTVPAPPPSRPFVQKACRPFTSSDPVSPGRSA